MAVRAAPMGKAVAGASGMPPQKVKQKTVPLPHGRSQVPVVERQAGNGESCVFGAACSISSISWARRAGPGGSCREPGSVGAESLSPGGKESQNR